MPNYSPTFLNFSRNLALFYFMVVHDSYTASNEQERKLWRLVGILCRAYSLPEDEFEPWKSGRMKRFLQAAAKDIIVLVKKLYGQTCCSYNIHHLLHLEEIRRHGPFPASSAFSTESYYSRIRKAVMFKPAKNIGKQILGSTYLQYAQGHYCHGRMVFQVKETQKSSDVYCYTYDKSTEMYSFFKIVDVGDNEVVVRRVVTASVRAEPQGVELSYLSKVGFMRYLTTLAGNETTLPMKDICGKAIRINDHITTCSTLTLFEAN